MDGELIYFGVVAGAVIALVAGVLVLGRNEKPPDPLVAEPEAFLGLDERIERFWSWLVENARAIRADRSGRFAPDITRQLATVSSELLWEIALRPSGPHDFVLSADGVLEHFPLVEEMTGVAPEVPGFQVVAFRQPEQESLTIETPAGALSTGDVWFDAQPADEGRIDLTLFVPDPRMDGAAVLLLDGQIGEYDAAMRTRELHCEELPAQPALEGLKRLRDLPDVIARLKLSGQRADAGDSEDAPVTGKPEGVELPFDLDALARDLFDCEAGSRAWQLFADHEVQEQDFWRAIEDDAGHTAAMDYLAWRAANAGAPVGPHLRRTAETWDAPTHYTEALLEEDAIEAELARDPHFTIDFAQAVWVLDVVIIATTFAHLIIEGALDDEAREIAGIALRRQADPLVVREIYGSAEDAARPASLERLAHVVAAA